MSNSITTAFNSFFENLSTTFVPTNTIDQYVLGFKNLATKSGTTLMLVVDKGDIQQETQATSLALIEAVIFVQVLRNVSMQDTLLQHLEDLYGYFYANPRLGGIQDYQLGEWDISVAEDGTSVGLLSLNIKLAIVI
jgi:hypothetical protein